jgi:tetratricopeptide (TPR) repeat protein
MTQVLSNRGQTTALYEQGLLYAGKQQWNKALKLYEQALTEDSPPQGKARIYAAMAFVKFARQDKERDLEAALGDYGKALTLFQSLALPREEAETHCALANVLVEFSPNQKEAAIAHYKKALGLLMWEGNQTARAEVWQRLGDLQTQYQDWNASLQSYVAGAKCAEEAKDVALQARLSECIGAVEQRRGNEVAALDAYNKAAKLYENYFQLPQEQLPVPTKKRDFIHLRLAQVYQKIGKIKQDRREWKDAEHYYSQANAIYHEFEEKTALDEVGKALDEIAKTRKDGWRKSLLSSGCPSEIVSRAYQFTECQKRGDLLGAAYVSEEGGKYLRDKKAEEKKADTGLIVEAFQDARWYYGQVGEKRGMAYASEQIATLETDQLNLATALEDYAKARWYYGEASDMQGQAYTSQHIAIIEMQLSNLEAALTDFNKAKNYYAESSDIRGLAYIYQKIGELESNRLNYLDAVTAYKEALNQYRAISDEKGEAYICHVLGDVEMALNNLSNALEHYQNAQTIYQKGQNSWGQAYIDSAMGKIYGEIGEKHRSNNEMLQAQQEWATALQKYQQALRFYEQMKDQEEQKAPPEIAAIFFGIGGIQRGWGKLDDALNSYQQASDIYERLKDFSAEAHVFEAIIDVLKIRRGPNDLERALRYAQREADLYQIAVDSTRDEVLHEIETNLPLCAITQAESENDHQVYIGKTYTIQAGIAPQKQADEFEIGPHDLTIALCDEIAPLFIDMWLYTSNGVTCLGEPHQQLCYSRKDKATQLVDFRFNVITPGSHIVEVDFYHKRRWLKTIPFKFVAVKQPQPAPSGVRPLHKTQLPLPMAGNYPVDVSLRIRSQQDNYTVDVSVGEYHFDADFPLLSSLTSIVAFNTMLHQKIAAFVEAWSQYAFNDHESVEKFNNALKKLAVAGKYAYATIFSEPLRELISQNMQEGGIIQIIADQDFALPWELLYVGPLDSLDLDTLDLDTLDALDLKEIDLNTIDPGYFWGMRYQIIRKPSIPIGPIPPTALRVHPHVGLIANRDLPAVRDKEILELHKLHEHEIIKLILLRDLYESGNHSDEIDYLLHQFLQSKDLDILHTACHSYISGEVFKNPILFVSENFAIKYDDLDLSEPFVIENQPLVILNACKTGQIIDSRYSYRWPQLFWRLGARGVLATEFAIPDDFAADFITEFYARFFIPETTISNALLETRKYYLQKKHNILGLAYTLYAPSTIKVSANPFVEDKSSSVSSSNRLTREMLSPLLYGKIASNPHKGTLESGSVLELPQISLKAKEGTLFYCPESKKLTDKFERKSVKSGDVYYCTDPNHHQPLEMIRKDNIATIMKSKQAWDSLFYCTINHHLLLALVRDMKGAEQEGFTCPEHQCPALMV